jgi:hypothetical protein
MNSFFSSAENKVEEYHENTTRFGRVYPPTKTDTG